MKAVLTFDYGVSNGRTVITYFDGGKLVTEKIMSFSNMPVYENGALRWDFSYLYGKLREGLQIAAAKYNIQSVGCSTWGADFALFDKNGKLLENPVHYRDKRTKGIPEEVFQIINKEKLFQRTGIQPYRHNTIFQLYYLAKYKRELLDKAGFFLPVANALSYAFTGVKAAEISIASTTGLLHGDNWDYELIKLLNIPISIFPPIIHTGVNCPIISPKEFASVPFTYIATHYPASAIMSIAPEGENIVYISCGTWSFMGTTVYTPVITAEAFKEGFTNERGGKGEITLLKNITGLWIVQQLISEWQTDIFTLSADINNADTDTLPVLDTDSEEFFNPKRMCDAVVNALGSDKYSKGEIIAAVYKSMALKYAECYKTIEKMTYRRYDKIYILGGSAENEILMKFIAKYTEKTIIAGPNEAAVFGGALCQINALTDDKKYMAEIKKSMERTDYIKFKP